MGRREVLPQVKEVPVIAGLNGVDPLRDMRLFLEDCRRIGYSGVHNFPTVAWFDGEFRRTLEGTGLGYEHEIRMLVMARELDMLSIGYAFNEEDCERLMKEAAPDIFIFHAGITRGGSTGYAGGSDIEDTARRSQHHYEIARRIKPDVILLAHGAALVEPAGRPVHAGPHGMRRGAARLEHRTDGHRKAAGGTRCRVQDRAVPLERPLGIEACRSAPAGRRGSSFSEARTACFPTVTSSPCWRQAARQ